MGMRLAHIPAFKADFIPSQVEVVIGKHLDNLLVESIQEVPGGFWGRVDRPKFTGGQQKDFNHSTTFKDGSLN